MHSMVFLIPAAHRRSQAATWLETMAGPLRLPPQPSEKEFIACLRSGIALCIAINKIKPGAVPKVSKNPSFLTKFFLY